MNMNNFIRFSCTMLALTLFSTSAFSVTGVVTGTLKSFNRLGHYCDDDGRDCTGSNYNKSDFSKYQPLRDMKVVILVDGRWAGFGTTNQFGAYQIAWSREGTWQPSVLKLITFLQHKDGRFTVYDSDATFHQLWGSTTNISVGTTSTNPQSLGTWYWGSANSPIDEANTYEGAWRTWRYAFQYSSRLRNYFNSLKIINNATVTNTLTNIVSGVSDFRGSTFTVRMGNDQQYIYNTIYHELGHAASYKASRDQKFQSATNYCWPTAGNCNGTARSGHNYQTPEWGAPQFEEGLADGIGVVSAFWSNNHEPIGCTNRPETACPRFNVMNSFDYENRTSQTCVAPEQRYELNTIRYVRDLYDQGDGVRLSFWKLIEGLYEFSNSSWENGKNEPWNSSLTAFDDLDGGRSTRDYQQHIDSRFSINSIPQYNYNCTPVGD